MLPNGPRSSGGSLVITCINAIRVEDAICILHTYGRRSHACSSPLAEPGGDSCSGHFCGMSRALAEPGKVVGRRVLEICARRTRITPSKPHSLDKVLEDSN